MATHLADRAGDAAPAAVVGIDRDDGAGRSTANAPRLTSVFLALLFLELVLFRGRAATTQNKKTDRACETGADFAERETTRGLLRD